MTLSKQVSSFAKQVQNHPIYRRVRKPKFPLGDLVIYPGVASSVGDEPGNVAGLLARHARGDFGDRWAVNDLRYRMNCDAVEEDLDVVSRFTSPGGAHTIVIHTEADRSRTTVYAEPCRLEVNMRGESVLSSTRDGLPERLTLSTPEDDSWRCLCGNDTCGDGFADADEGAEDDPDRYVTTDTLVCGRCGRLFDRESRFVQGRRPVTWFTELPPNDVGVTQDAQ